jgi:hypothetical protein
MENRKCLVCYEQLKGRADQKFCSDQCRSAFNNKLNPESRHVIKSVNRILKKNYIILCALQAKGKVTTSKSDLQNKGYRFDYFTCTNVTRTSRISYFCYDQGFRELENDKVTLVRRAQKETMAELLR